jgi:riboflavin synthase
VSLIPTTLEMTTLGRLAPGSQVNLEVDVIAKYVESLLASAPPGCQPAGTGQTGARS